MTRRLPDKIAPGARRAITSLRHGLKGLLHVPGRTVGQARDDGPSGEHVGIGREHGRGHCPAGGQPNDEDAPAIDAMVPDHPLDHLPDRERLAVVALGIGRQKPVEAVVRIVGALLLGKQHRESVGVGERRPSRTVVIDSGGLRAPMRGYERLALELITAIEHNRETKDLLHQFACYLDVLYGHVKMRAVLRDMFASSSEEVQL